MRTPQHKVWVPTLLVDVPVSPTENRRVFKGSRLGVLVRKIASFIKSKKYWVGTLLVAFGFALSSLSEASSSIYVAKFAEWVAVDAKAMHIAMMNALRGEVDDTRAVIETSPTVLKASISEIIWMNDRVQAGTANVDDAAELVQIGQP
jgi:hypothetical protein